MLACDCEGRKSETDAGDGRGGETEDSNGNDGGNDRREELVLNAGNGTISACEGLDDIIGTIAVDGVSYGRNGDAVNEFVRYDDDSIGY